MFFPRVLAVDSLPLCPTNAQLTISRNRRKPPKGDVGTLAPEGPEAVGQGVCQWAPQQNVQTTHPHPLPMWDCPQPPVLWGFLDDR